MSDIIRIRTFSDFHQYMISNAGAPTDPNAFRQMLNEEKLQNIHGYLNGNMNVDIAGNYNRFLKNIQWVKKKEASASTSPSVDGTLSQEEKTVAPEQQAPKDPNKPFGMEYYPGRPDITTTKDGMAIPVQHTPDGQSSHIKHDAPINQPGAVKIPGMSGVMLPSDEASRIEFDNKMREKTEAEEEAFNNRLRDNLHKSVFNMDKTYRSLHLNSMKDQFIDDVIYNNQDKDFVKRIKNPNKLPSLPLDDGRTASHLMSYAEIDGKYWVYPEVVNKGGKLVKLDRLEAVGYAKKTGEFIVFDTQEEAEVFSSSYKRYWMSAHEKAEEKREQDKVLEEERKRQQELIDSYDLKMKTYNNRDRDYKIEWGKDITYEEIAAKDSQIAGIKNDINISKNLLEGQKLVKYGGYLDRYIGTNKDLRSKISQGIEIDDDTKAKMVEEQIMKELQPALEEYDILRMRGVEDAAEQVAMALSKHENLKTNLQDARNNLKQFVSRFPGAIPPEQKQKYESLIQEVNNVAEEFAGSLQELNDIYNDKQLMAMAGEYNRVVDKINYKTKDLETLGNYFPSVAKKHAKQEKLEKRKRLPGAYAPAMMQDAQKRAWNSFSMGAYSTITILPRLYKNIVDAIKDEEYTGADYMMDKWDNWMEDNLQFTTMSKIPAVKDGKINLEGLSQSLGDQAGVFASILAVNYMSGASMVGGVGGTATKGIKATRLIKNMRETVMPAAMISFKEYDDMAMKQGLRGLNAVGYAAPMALMEGISELVMPNHKFFTRGVKKRLLKEYAEILAKDGVEAAKKGLFDSAFKVMYKTMKSAGAESLEEMLVLAANYGNDLMWAVSDPNIEVHKPTLDEIYETALVSGIIGGSMQMPGAVGEAQYDMMPKTKQLMLYTLAENYESSKDIINNLYTEEKAQGIMDQVDMYHERLDQVPEGVSEAKGAAIIDKLIEAEKLNEHNEKINDPKNPVTNVNKKKIKEVENEITEIIENEDYDAEIDTQVQDELNTTEETEAETEALKDVQNIEEGSTIYMESSFKPGEYEEVTVSSNHEHAFEVTDKEGNERPYPIGKSYGTFSKEDGHVRYTEADKKAGHTNFYTEKPETDEANDDIIEFEDQEGDKIVKKSLKTSEITIDVTEGKIGDKNIEISINAPVTKDGVSSEKSDNIGYARLGKVDDGYTVWLSGLTPSVEKNVSFVDNLLDKVFKFLLGDKHIPLQRTKSSLAGKGVGKVSYKAIAELLDKNNLNLYSDIIRSEGAEGMWSSLEKRGLAEKVLEKGVKKAKRSKDFRYKFTVSDVGSLDSEVAETNEKGQEKPEPPKKPAVKKEQPAKKQPAKTNWSKEAQKEIDEETAHHEGIIAQTKDRKYLQDTHKRHKGYLDLLKKDPLAYYKKEAAEQEERLAKLPANKNERGVERSNAQQLLKRYRKQIKLMEGAKGSTPASVKKKPGTKKADTKKQPAKIKEDKVVPDSDWMHDKTVQEHKDKSYVSDKEVIAFYEELDNNLDQDLRLNLVDYKWIPDLAKNNPKEMREHIEKYFKLYGIEDKKKRAEHWEKIDKKIGKGEYIMELHTEGAYVINDNDMVSFVDIEGDRANPKISLSDFIKIHDKSDDNRPANSRWQNNTMQSLSTWEQSFVPEMKMSSEELTEVIDKLSDDKFAEKHRKEQIEKLRNAVKNKVVDVSTHSSVEGDTFIKSYITALDKELKAPEHKVIETHAKGVYILNPDGTVYFYNQGDVNHSGRFRFQREWPAPVKVEQLLQQRAIDDKGSVTEETKETPVEQQPEEQEPKPTDYEKLAFLKRELPKKQPAKRDRVDNYSDYGEYDISPLEKNYSEKSVDEAMGDLISTKELTPPILKGIYYDAKNQRKVVADGYILMMQPEKISGKSKLVDPKTNKAKTEFTSKILEDEYPNYEAVIPRRNSKVTGVLSLKELLDNVAGVSRAHKFVTSEIYSDLMVGDMQYRLATENFEKLLRAFYQSGTKTIVMSVPDNPNSSILIRDNDNKDKMGVIVGMKLENPQMRYSVVLETGYIQDVAHLKAQLKSIENTVASVQEGYGKDLAQAKKKKEKEKIKLYESRITEAQESRQVEIDELTQRIAEIEKDPMNAHVGSVSDVDPKKVNAAKPKKAKPKPKPKPTPKKDPKSNKVTDTADHLVFLKGELGAKPLKKDRVDNFANRGEYEVQPIHRKVKVTEGDKAFEKIVGKDDIRPVMMGVYHDAKAQVRVATNAHMMLVVPTKVKGKSKIIDPKTKYEYKGNYPVYQEAIPANALHTTPMELDGLLSKARGVVKANRFVTDPMYVQIAYDNKEAYYSADLFNAILDALAQTGTTKIKLELNNKDGRGLIIRDVVNPEKMGLVMPIFVDKGDNYRYVNVLRTETVQDPAALRKEYELEKNRQPLALDFYEKQLKEAEEKKDQSDIDYYTNRIKEAKKEQTAKLAEIQARIDKAEGKTTTNDDGEVLYQDRKPTGGRGRVIKELDKAVADLEVISEDETRKITEEEVDQVKTILDAMAKTWGKIMNRPADNFYDNYIEGIRVKEGEDRRFKTQPQGLVQFAKDGLATVTLFKSADISTLVHEFAGGHLARRVLEDLAAKDSRFKRQYNITKAWAGVKNNNWTKRAEEKFARGWERYLLRGQAPSSSLARVFEVLRDSLRSIYKNIKGSKVDVPVTTAIQNTFDMLLTEGTIERKETKKVDTSLFKEFRDEERSGREVLSDEFESFQKRAQSWLRRQMKIGGNMPKPFRRLFESNYGWVRKMEANVNMKKAIIKSKIANLVKQELGMSKLPVNGSEKRRRYNERIKEIDLDMQNALENMGYYDPMQRQEALETLPESIREDVAELRDDVDNLSEIFLSSGFLTDAQELAIDDNLGIYLTRSYRKWDDPNWKWKNIPDNVRNAAKKWLIENMPENTAESKIDAILLEIAEKPEGISQEQFIKGGKAGSKDLSILKQRNLTISPEMRALMGEYRDPLFNYTKSMIKMADLIAKNRVLEEIKEAGMGKFLFDENTRKPGWHVPIASEGSDTMSPLNGIYTSPEIAKAFEDFNKSEVITQRAVRMYVGFLSLVKYNKTILSPMTHIRNWLSNFALHVANGRWPFGKEFIMATKILANDFAKTPKRELAERYQRYVELGVVKDSAGLGEVKGMMKAAALENWDVDQMMMNRMKKNIRKYSTMPIAKAQKFAEKMYLAEDDFHKIIAFEIEKRRYKKVFVKKGLSPAEAEANADVVAAEMTRSTMPTYSLVPRLGKTVGKFFGTGSFVSFPIEIKRVTWNTAVIGIRELRDPDTRHLGAMRLGGLASATMLIPGIVYISRLLTGISKDKEDDMRWLVPPWTENSEFAHIAEPKDGVYQYIDLAGSDPHNILRKTFRAMLRGDSFGDIMREGFNEFVDPYVSTEIGTEYWIEIGRNNKTGINSKVWTKDADISTITGEVLDHHVSKVAPGFLANANRIRKAYVGEQRGQKGYSVKNEVIAMFTGQRLTTYDMGKAFYYDLTYEGERIGEAIDLYRGAIKDGYVGDKLERKREEAERMIREATDRAHLQYQRAKRLGVPMKDLQNTVDYMRYGRKGNRADKVIKRAVREGNFNGLNLLGDVY